ncbi:MAG: SUMF1/EgtB/PvdO family nonheme iron enzyme [Bacteroidales bacterium]|jgi:formylglycine-generating enzyme required for sulfatase activity|nr:SUMF1/EgtB/PvdO family nonheme iron enzyme [Bacteroidales bacterium]
MKREIKIMANLLLTAVFAAVSASCSKEATGVTLDKSTLMLAVGATETLTATVAPDNAADKTLTWISSAPEVAAVDGGAVTAIVTGTATVTVATANGRTATCEVTVEQYTVETVLIPKGTFLMGSSDGSAVGVGTPGTDPNATAAEPERRSNETQHRVTLTRDYYMGKYPVTSAQYAGFLNDVGVDRTGAKAGIQGGETLIAEGGSLYYNGSRWDFSANYKNHPVTSVTWYGAKAYAEWAGGDLPTEAQWERAARGGVENMPFGLGDGKKLTDAMANFYGRSPYDLDRGGLYSESGAYLERTTEAGAYSANAYGLYDMHGNVFEWCLDWWDGSSSYASSPATDPVGTTGSERVLRGGDFGSNAAYCRSAYRDEYSPNKRRDRFGFRIVFYP